MINGDSLTTNNNSNSSILYGLLGVQKHLQQVWYWNFQMNNKQASQTTLLYQLLLFGSHPDPLKHFLNFFHFNRCSFSNYFGNWITLLCMFFLLIMYLDRAWVATTTSMSKEPASMSKNLPSTGINENFVGYLTSTCH